jgi:hypothetical protein
MTKSYLLAPEPIWSIINHDGTPSGGARMFTRRSQNKVEDKPTFQDPGGNEAWTNPIVFNLNGTQGPIYWEVDSANLSDTYYIFVLDADGNQIWEVDNFAPPGSGGGGDVTTYITLQNYITNNQFINHIAATSSPTNSTNILLAPSNHKGFTPAPANPVVGTFGVLGPDIRFVKNNTTATDQITFPLFPLGTPVLTGDVTPVDYIRYVSNAVSGETYKSFQFPITQKVNNLSNQDMSFTIWAAVTATPVTINIYSRQYYGSGTAATPESVTTRPLIGSCDLTTTWTPFVIHFTVPNTSGNSIGTPGSQTNDDAFYIQVDMPLNSACDVLFTKPALYLGTIDPNLEFESYDQIDSINSTARTGDIKTSLVPTPPMGWLAMDDSTIGNTGSGATTEGDITFQLYSTIYTAVSDAWAPVLPSGRTAPGNTMANAITDFLAGQTLKLPRSLGRALAGAGTGAGLTARALGEYTGEETHVLTTNEMPSHTHPTISGNFVVTGGASASLGAGTGVSTVGTTGSRGGDAAHNNMQPTSFFNVFIKL